MHLLLLGPCVRTLLTFTLHLPLFTLTLPSQATLGRVQGKSQNCPQRVQRVSSPVTLSFGNSNVAISPAGTERANSGHHHLLINLQELPAMDMPLPASAQVIHFGKGQTETTLELEPGVHSLQLLLGNHLHVPHARPVMSEKITITVE